MAILQQLDEQEHPLGEEVDRSTAFRMQQFYLDVEYQYVLNDPDR